MVKSLRELRKNRGLSIKQLASLAGCSARTLSEYETNPPATVNRQIISRLAKILDVTPEYILTLIGSVANAPTTHSAQQTKTQIKSNTPGSKKIRNAKVKTAVQASVPKGRAPKKSTGLTVPQRTNLVVLIDERVDRLRNFVLDAERASSEDCALKILTQDVCRDIQNLEEIRSLLLS